jgi:protein O-mannosyl-transferase
MKTISTHTFKYTLRDIHKNTENRKFCFVIGAGASRKSGIPTGKELAEEWFAEIKERLNDSELKKWLKEQKIDVKELAASYGMIYRKRFENDKNSGYEFLVQAMKSAKPSLGHFVMAQILSRYSGHCVLTTNFDSLIESSIYQLTNKTPLVCGHESLSGYARPSQTHPLIIKIHRDLLLAPKSDPDEINKLDPGWKEPLDHIFSTHIPVVIGYGGNDGSLMSYFETMNKPSNFFWCGLNENSISKRIKKVIENHEGIFVTINGFDELMYELLQVFDEIKPIKDELNEITSERIQTTAKQLEEIKSPKIKEDTKPTKESTTTKEKKELSAFEYSNLAEKEPDFEKRKQIYLKALEKYPSTGWLWSKFTYFLHSIKEEYAELEAYYQAALSADINNSIIKGNYANYLHKIKKDYAKAEEYYLLALAADPGSAIKNVNYADFLQEIKRDSIKAEEYFLKALAVDSEMATNNAVYANFLKNVKRDYTKAGEHYLKALFVDPDNANMNANYAQLLLEIGNIQESEKYIYKAFKGAEENDVLLELWFYRYAHFPEFLSEAEIKIEELLSKGIRSIDWDFSGNIERAIKDGHPNPEKLNELARRITTE